jgi:hypothetical protein
MGGSEPVASGASQAVPEAAATEGVEFVVSTKNQNRRMDACLVRSVCALYSIFFVPYTNNCRCFGIRRVFRDFLGEESDRTIRSETGARTSEAIA